MNTLPSPSNRSRYQNNRSPDNAPTSSCAENKQVNDLLRKIETQVGEMIMAEIKDPSTDYTAKTATLVLAHLSGALPGAQRAAERLNLSTKEVLSLAALRGQGSCN